MAIILGDSISLNASKPSLDKRWGPYNSVQQAFDYLDDRDVLCVGITVGVKNAETGAIDEYWFRTKAESVTDLVKKNEDDSIMESLSGIHTTLQTMTKTLQSIDERLDKQEEAQEAEEWEEV